jgi:hypothetical protein
LAVFWSMAIPSSLHRVLPNKPVVFSEHSESIYIYVCVCVCVCIVI